MSADHATLAHTAIAWMYLGANSLRVLSYAPQIVAVWRARDGAASMSLLTWTAWTLSNVAATLYGTVVVGDTFLAIVSSLNLLGCGAVSSIVAHRRLALRRDLPARGQVARHDAEGCSTAC